MDKASSITNTLAARSIIPFTGGLFPIYAFFWPVQFGTWFGSIVHAFRLAAGV